MIYVILKGRIGNQLFMYSLAKQIQKEFNYEQEILIDDKSVLKVNWEDSLNYYPLKNTSFVHNHKKLISPKFILPFIGFILYKLMVHNKDYMTKYQIEKKYQNMFNRMGFIICENGYIPYKLYRKNILLHGYFQSPKYFNKVEHEIKEIYSLKSIINEIKYEGLDKIRERNSVCISIKVEHNVGNKDYDVCTKKYWEKAINYIIEKVDNPLFFICSDNVEYVKKNLIDCEKYDVVCQDTSFPVHISLAIMGLCKHFIIGNTTFGWWAQYLSTNENKIVIAPSKWMNCEMPIDIYQEQWHLI